MVKVPVTTTIDSDIYKWIKEQGNLSEWIEMVANECIGVGIYPKDVGDIKRKMRFFAQKTVDLQEKIDILEKKNTKLTRKLENLAEKIEKK